jgi:hypothetical protein
MPSLTLNKHQLYEGTQSEGIIKSTEENIWIKEGKKNWIRRDSYLIFMDPCIAV